MMKMDKMYLRQMLTYINKVYHMGEKIKVLKDKRKRQSFKTSVIATIVLIGFMVQVSSFNRIQSWIKRGKRFKNIFSPGTKLPKIDAIRETMEEFELGSISDMHDGIVKTIFRNKVFRDGTIGGFKVSAIDGVELFESTKKSCEECLTRKINGVMHYFHRSVVCMTVGGDPHIILGQEMLKPKKDGSNKDEGELTGGKRLLDRLHGQYGHFADIIVTDALYMKAPWIKAVLDIQMDAVIRVKEERLNIVKDALGLFKSRKADKEWEVNKNFKVKVWDEDSFEINGLDRSLRFLRFVEYITKDGKTEEKEMWVVTTLSKSTPPEIIWRIMHKRWDIEENGFHTLKTYFHADHCFVHSPVGIEAVFMFMLIAFNLSEMFMFKCLRNFREKKMLRIDLIEDFRDELTAYNYSYLLDTG